MRRVTCTDNDKGMQCGGTVLRNPDSLAGLRLFFAPGVVRDVVMARVRALRAVFVEAITWRVRCFGVSLLLVYDASACDRCDVRLIDFAHSHVFGTREEAVGKCGEDGFMEWDGNVVEALDSLIAILTLIGKDAANANANVNADFNAEIA